MIKLNLLIFTALAFGSSAFGQTQKKPTFRIEGTVQGFKNGTKLYLSDLTDGTYNNQIDSTSIENNQFYFKGNVKAKYLKSAISTTDFEYRIIFWLEKGITSFSGERNNFKKSIILGSKLQSDQNKLDRMRNTLENTEKIDYGFIRNNPTSIISAQTLTSYCNTWSKDTISTLYNLFSKEVKSTNYAKKVFNFISLNRNIKIGDKFFDFLQKDTSNKVVRLSDFKNKIILLEFWGSWCGPCREENPVLRKIYNEFSVKGFEIFGVAAETDRQQWVQAIKADKLPWINVTDYKGTSNKAVLIYGVSGYPTNYLIDRNGIIISKDIYGEQLRKKLLDSL